MWKQKSRDPCAIISDPSLVPEHKLHSILLMFSWTSLWSLWQKKKGLKHDKREVFRVRKCSFYFFLSPPSSPPITALFCPPFIYIYIIILIIWMLLPLPSFFPFSFCFSLSFFFVFPSFFIAYFYSFYFICITCSKKNKMTKIQKNQI